jgi:AraC-like DNA-binding protein
MAQKKKITDIPLHRLTDTTASGFYMRRMQLTKVSHVPIGPYHAHRDDHFLFFLLEKGTCRVNVDFQLVESKGPMLYYILPGQVHHYQAAERVEGWFMALDSMLLGDYFRPVFESQLQQEPLALKKDQLQQMGQLLELLQHWYLLPDAAFYKEQMIERLLASFIGTAAAAYTEKEATLQQSYSRPALITREFRQLVSRHYCEMKQPAAYANELHLSLSYLNEVVKATTGFPVTYWIHHEIMLEARRLLYYSDLSVKEIAHRVGYDDHTYFSRLFHKIVHTTPLQFRKRYRE